MPPTVLQSARTPHQTVGQWFVDERGTPRRRLLAGFKTLHTDQRDWPLPAHRRGTLGGMDAATALTGTYL
ncbi:hypothetical protein CLM98_10545 [Xanthomonas citri pv. citri]|nr:hypothetical protein B7L65_14030 [Xanthomonas citri pv. citri]ARR23806.1 hypothetical protein B7L67_21520 [Xanthomonas citri pv. citri]AUZ50947.1 hypothetical protein CLM98_10545 [Xanthomonas citri pv. citri]